MATKLEEFEFTRTYGNKPKYPWDEWLDGSIWKLVNGEDFQGVSSKHFSSSIYNNARKRGMKARIQALDAGDTLVVQAYEPENKKSPPSPKR